MLNIHASLLIVYYKVAICKVWLQNTKTNELPYFHFITDKEKKKMTIIRYFCIRNDKIMHRSLTYTCLG